MQDDYLNLAVELYEKGIWNEETFVKKVTLYGKEKNVEVGAINELINRVVKKKEYTIEDKRKFLSVLTLGDNKPKYGDVVTTFTDDMVEKFYELEVSSLDDKEVQKYFDLVNSKEVLVGEASKPVLNPVQKLKVDDLFEVKEDDNKSLNLSGIKSNEENNNESSSKEEIHDEENNEFVIPNISEINTSEMPESEEEFTEQAENILSKEEDSVVTPVNAEPERIEKLKKSKGNVKKYFLRTAIIISAAALFGLDSVALIGGYWYFADKIKKGEFNPNNLVGKAIKSGVQYVMNIGKNKGKMDVERGKVR